MYYTSQTTTSNYFLYNDQEKECEKMSQTAMDQAMNVSVASGNRHANPARPKLVISSVVFSNFTPFSVMEKLIFSNVSVMKPW